MTRVQTRRDDGVRLWTGLRAQTTQTTHCARMTEPKRYLAEEDPRAHPDPLASTIPGSPPIGE
jgi:hypothetical protein